jgi:hypothetical protein
VGKCRTYTVRDDREHIIQAFNMTLAHASNILSVRYLTAEMKKKNKKKRQQDRLLEDIRRAVTARILRAVFVF